MKSIRIQNLRSLIDTGHIEFKPITLLVGANSSGKSSFLRVLPLLRQSVETRTLSGLLLNEGDVTFGNCQDAINRNADPAEMKFEFSLTLNPGFFRGGQLNRFLANQTPIRCEVTYAPRSSDKRYPFLKNINIHMGNTPHLDIISINADETGSITSFIVNGYQANDKINTFRLYISRGIIPTIELEIDEKEIPSSLSEVSWLEKKLIQQTKNAIHGKTSTARRLAIFNSIRIDNAENMLLSIKSKTGVSSWDSNVQKWSVASKEFQDFRNLLMASKTSSLLSSINAYISHFAVSINYFQPVRANVQRDYLSRDVQVSSVDPSGSNVAMVLTSLRAQSLKDFRKWMNSNFGFEIYPESVADGARISLRMIDNITGETFNLADMGFGFSQMLPFLVQIWDVVENESKSRMGIRHRLNPFAIPQGVTIAIEQPELHLHPALQARLADLFVKVATLSEKNGFPVRFVLETHSPTIIECIGALVEQKSIDPSSVQVLLFERSLTNSKQGATTVRTSEFDTNGVLQDWPFGFLSATPTGFASSIPSEDNIKELK